jgi:hypothetical protein
MHSLTCRKTGLGHRCREPFSPKASLITRPHAWRSYSNVHAHPEVARLSGGRPVIIAPGWVRKVHHSPGRLMCTSVAGAEASVAPHRLVLDCAGQEVGILGSWI